MQDLPGLSQCFNPNRKFERPQLQDTEENEQQFDRFQGCMDMVSKFAHTFLYCRNPAEILTVSESKILANQRNKYLSFISKNYKYKIPQQFSSRKLMKQKRNELLQKQKEQQQKHEDLKSKKRPRKTQQNPQPKKRQKPNAEQAKKPKNTKQVRKGLLNINIKDIKDIKDTKDIKNVQINEEQNQGIQEVPDVQNNFESSEDLANRDLDVIDDEDNPVDQ